jgi:hypothetical protein
MAGMAGPATDVEGAVVVHGNVAGSIVRGDRNIVVHTNHGSIVQTTIEAVRRRWPPARPPAPPEPFVGRARELEWLAGVPIGRGVTISGPRGAGRTALMRAAAARAARPDWETVLRVDGLGDGGGSLSLDDLAQLLHDAAWECVPAVKVDAGSARSGLGGVAALALVDDVALWGRDLERLVDLLPSGAVIVALRRPAVDSELPDIPVGALPRPDAIALLRAKTGLLAGATESGDLDAVAGLLSDWPEALVIAGRAIRVRGLPLEAARTELAATEPQSGEAEVAALERAYALAYPALDGNMRRVLIAAAVLPGGTHDPGVLRRVLGEPAWFDAAVDSLRALELLSFNSPRLRLPDGIRELLRDGAGAAAVELEDTHLDEVVARERQRVLDPELEPAALGGLIGAFEHALRTGKHEVAVVLGRSIAPRLVLAGLWDAWGSIGEGVRAAAVEVGWAKDAAWATHELGTRELGRGHDRAARELLMDALAQRRALGDAEGAAYTLHNLRWGGPGDSRPSDDSNGHGGDRTLWQRLAFWGGIGALQLALLVLAGPTVASVFGGFVGGPEASPSPSPTAVATATPTSPAGEASQTPAVALDVRARGHGYSIVENQWRGTLEVSVSGGTPPYVVTLEDGSGSDANPASFQVGGTTCVAEELRGTVTDGDGVEAPFDVSLLPDPCTAPAPSTAPPTKPPPACVDFERLEPAGPFGAEVGDRPGDVLLTTARGIRVTLLEYRDSPEAAVFGNGFVTSVENVGNGQGVFAGPLVFSFDFVGLDFEPRAVEFAFLDGVVGPENIVINDDDVAFVDLIDPPVAVNGTGLSVNYAEGFEDRGLATLTGRVDRLGLGGVEFYLDDVCALP